MSVKSVALAEGDINFNYASSPSLSRWGLRGSILIKCARDGGHFALHNFGSYSIHGIFLLTKRSLFISLKMGDSED